MTDRLAALRGAVASSHSRAAGRARRLLSALFGQPAHHRQVARRLQATIPEPATLDRVRALTAASGLLGNQSNRVRALIGGFAHGNQTQFNRPDGAGYDFVADTVLALDPKNPQVAARTRDGIPLMARARAGPPGARRRVRCAVSRTSQTSRATFRDIVACTLDCGVSDPHDRV